MDVKVQPDVRGARDIVAKLDIERRLTLRLLMSNFPRNLGQKGAIMRIGLAAVGLIVALNITAGASSAQTQVPAPAPVEP
jgi:hypothetical protein